jgi:hypothetical protein
VLRRGDYNPVKNGVIRRSTFRSIMMIWTVDFYMQNPRRGMEDIPACRWRDHFGAFTPDIPDDLDFLNTALGEHAFRTAFHYGIDIFHLRYNNQQLKNMRDKTDLNGLAEAKERIRQLVQQDLVAYPHHTHKSSAQFMEYLQRDAGHGGNESPRPPYTENGPQKAPRDIPEEDLPDLKTNFTSSDPDDEDEDDDLD